MVSMRSRALLTMLIGMSISLPTHAAPLVGRVFDSMEGVVFANAEVLIDGLEDTASTDRHGFFRFAEVQTGAHRVSILLSDGRRLSSQVLIRANRSMSLAEFDFSRIIPPDEDDDY